MSSGVRPAWLVTAALIVPVIPESRVAGPGTPYLQGVLTLMQEMSLCRNPPSASPLIRLQ